MPKLVTSSYVVNDDGEYLAETFAESAYELPPVEPPTDPPLPPPEPPPSDIWNPPSPPTEGIRTAVKTPEKTWKQVMAEISGGGRIVVSPGVHPLTIDDAYVYTQGWGMLEIVGEKDAAGNRPLLDVRLNSDGRTLNNVIGWSGNNGNLWLTSVRIHGAGSNILAAGSGPRWPISQKVVLDNVELAYGGHHNLMMAYEFSGALQDAERLAPVDDELWIRNSDIHHSGSTHSHYCDRIAKEVVVNSRFYSARGLSGHAFKSLPRNLIVVDSEISNVELDGSIDTNIDHHSFRRGTPPDMYLGAVPVSIVAGQRGYFARNRVTHRTHAAYNTGGYCVAMQGRHSIHGIEIPDPMDPSSDFYSPDFWATAEDWVTLFEDNEYIVLGDSADMPRQRVYMNHGTYPVYNGQPVRPMDNVPTFWRERSRPVCRGDKVRGFTLTGGDLYASVDYGHGLNPTDDPVGRFTVETDPVVF